MLNKSLNEAFNPITLASDVSKLKKQAAEEDDLKNKLAMGAAVTAAGLGAVALAKKLRKKKKEDFN